MPLVSPSGGRIKEGGILVRKTLKSQKSKVKIKKGPKERDSKVKIKKIFLRSFATSA
jgi:uncharacterized protein YggU (UPF0235/DUF167 family)